MDLQPQKDDIENQNGGHSSQNSRQEDSEALLGKQLFAEPSLSPLVDLSNIKASEGKDDQGRKDGGHSSGSGRQGGKIIRNWFNPSAKKRSGVATMGKIMTALVL